MNAAVRSYRNAEVTTLSQRELIVKLYEGSERFLTMAQEAMKNRQIEQAHINCTKAKAIFSELMSTLSFEAGGEVAEQLLSLYVFFLTHISEANMRKKPEMLAELMPIIAELRTAWEGIPAELADHSSISRSQGHSFFVQS